MPDSTVPVSLRKISDYNDPALPTAIGDVLDASGLEIRAGMKVLAKPNLLMAHNLSCASPRIIAGACAWLLDHGAKVTVADSPAFGTARAVAHAIGLDLALAPLGLETIGFSRGPAAMIQPLNEKPLKAAIAPEALESDLILSIPRVKAHSQMRYTGAVKNCFGCMRGIHKALAHAPSNLTPEKFADRVAALWAALPPVAALCDGITAMSHTGPRNGRPFALGIIGASVSAPALDNAILRIIDLPPEEVPLCMALQRRAAAGDWHAAPDARFPLLHPEQCKVSGFQAPKTLKNISFNPYVLAKSLVRRIWQERG